MLQGVFWCYNAAMVYKLSSNQTCSWWKIFGVVAVAYGLPVFLIVAVILYLMHPDIVVEVLLIAFGLTLISTMIRATNMMRAQKRSLQLWGDIFVTLTERGMLMETPVRESKTYIPWHSTEKVSVVAGMMLLTLKSGMPLLLPVTGVKPERLVEMQKFCQEHVGREVPVEKQIALPEEYSSDSPRKRMTTPVTRQEDADVLMQRLYPKVPWVCLLLAPVMLAAGLILVWRYLMVDEWWMLAVAVISFYYAFRSLHAFWHPGCRMKKWIQREEACEVHFQRGHVLVNSPGNMWTLLSEKQVEGALETDHSYIYQLRSGGLLSIGKEMPPPASLPVPEKVSKRGRVLALVGSLLLVPLILGAVAAWCCQEGCQDEDDPGSEFAAYVEELTPVHGAAGRLRYAMIEEDSGARWLTAVWDDFGVLLYLGETEQSQSGSDD